MIIKQALRDHLIELGLAKSTWEHNAPFAEAAMAAIESEQISPEKFQELQFGKVAKTSKGLSVADVFGGDDIRVKKPSERYNATKSIAKHARSGMAVCDEKGRQVETVSELEYAKAGAFLKHRAARDGQPAELSEHEREMVAEMYDSDSWCGKISGQYETAVSGQRVKALLNDSTSGGRELVPEWFDSAIIQYPLLHSELLPKVDLRDVPRGSAVETASVGNPTVVWGTPEGTTMGIFDTSSLVAGIDTSLHNVVAAIEVGKDFLSDAAADVGRVLVENIGQRLLSELDRVVAKGNGVTEPLGIFNSSMIDIGNPAGGNGATPQVADYEELMFSVGKQYRNAAMRPVFISNDVTYSRCRGISVGASDARRVFGMDYENYQLMGHPFLVQNDLANNYAAFVCMARYRLYRRMAQSVEFISGGKELALKNLTMLVVRGRFGGKLIDANAAAFSDNFQA